MKASELMFIGIKGSVVALNRATGEQIWATRLKTQFKGRGFVNVLLQNGELLAACDGEVFCLDQFTGNTRWHNPLKGYGTGLATIATESNLAIVTLAAQMEMQSRQAASASAVAATG